MRRTETPLPAQLLEQDADDAPPGRVEGGGRLVEEEDARRAHEGLRDAEPLLHPLRHAVDTAIGGVGERDELEQPPPLLRTAGGGRELLVERENLVGRVPAGEAEELGEIAELRTRRAGAGARAGHLHPAAGRTDEPDGDLDERRLAGAVRAEQAHELALLHREIDSPERLDRAVTLGEVVDGEGRHRPSVQPTTLCPMPRGYMEGPAAEEAERRADEAARGVAETQAPEVHAAVYGCTEADPAPHFLGWLGEVDPDELFASGAAWGVTVRRMALAE